MRRYVILFIILFFSSVDLVYGLEEVNFYSCVDGDTLKVIYGGEVVKVRLLAIDTPESVKSNSEVEYYGKEASNYTCNRIKRAEKLELEFDVNSDKYDKYNRLLAWFYVDGELLQEELVEYGYAEVAYLYGDYLYTDMLLLKEKQAKDRGIGIWKNKGEDNHREYIKFSSVIMLIVIGLFLSILWYSRYHCGKVSKIS